MPPAPSPVTSPLPADVDAVLDLLARGNYVADRALATVLFLALKRGRPLFLEGEAGVGKTEIARVLSETLGRRLVRLQCYEGLDVASAVYEWNYPRQMREIRLAEAAGEHDREQGDIPLVHDAAEQLRTREAHEAVGTARQSPPFDGAVFDNEGEGNGHHRQVRPADTKRRQCEQQTDHRGHQTGDGKRDPEPEAVQHQDGGRISTDGEEPDVTERYLTGQPQQDIEADADQHVHCRHCDHEAAGP